MKILKAIQDAIANCIHTPDVNIDVQSYGFKVTVNLGPIMAQDDALAVMNLCTVLTEWADKKGFDPEDTPFHFSTNNFGILFVMEFFNRESGD